VAIDDVNADIKGKSDAKLLEIAYSVKDEYQNNSLIDLEYLAEIYGIKEINIVNDNGIIINSTELDVINKYDMNSKDQSKEFVDVLKTNDSHVQEYGPRGKDETELRKYAAVNLDNGGFIQVGYDAAQFHQMLNEFVIDITRNRHVGTDGFIMAFDEQFNVVSDNEYANMHITSLGINIPDEMLNGKTATKLYDAYVLDKQTGESEKYIYVFKFIEGYCIVASMPESDAVFMRDAAIYTSVFMEILIFSSLFVFIYILIKRVIINNIKKINMTLGQITEGDLNVVVDVRSNEEFSSLSDDINSTVATLKYYIAEAAARIDKELEYAKQIQLSALPTNFPDEKEYSIYAKMIAAKEVGGDFYDYYKLSETKVAFIVADVSGKGIPSAMFMMSAKTIIKDLAESGMSVDEIFTVANKKLCENNESGMFVTAWMGIIDIKTGVMQYANAGHNPPLLRCANGEVKYLKSRPGFVLAGMDTIRYRVNEIKLSLGDRIFLYTDGVTEATDKEEKLYGEVRLAEFMKQNPNLAPEAFLHTLKKSIDEFVGDAPQFDDISMLIFDYKGKEENIVINKEFAAQKEVLPDVFEFIETTLDSFGCSTKIQTAISVAMEEIFVNIANYAYGNDKGNVKINIIFNISSRIVTFKITDKGIKFNPLEISEPDITLSVEERKIGGLGILIAKKTMDTVTYIYQNNENILTMTKKI
jgi:anti-sigma regulatory factor (Ser/Thr protein kinase)